jgi:serine protease AprX
MLLGGPAAQAPASASLLGGLLGVVTGTVSAILTPGWDDNANTPPASLALVNDAIGADELHARGIDGDNVGVALIDSGIAPVGNLATANATNAPDLSFESQASDYRYLDTYGHGTHMAGIITSVAPGAHLVSLKVATRDGAVDVTQVIAAIDWVVAHRSDPGMNIRVLNLAFGTDGVQGYQSDPLTHAVESAWRNGITVVVAGGNEGSERPALTNPATDPYVIAVGAADLKNTAGVSDDTVAPFSSRGSSLRSVDVVAPGVSIASLRTPGSTIDDAHPTARVGEDHFRGSGTSQAAAVTSGGAALLLQQRPNLTPDQLKSLLRSTASTLRDTSARAQGRGRINVVAASNAPVPIAQQAWSASRGTGLLEAARGSSHVSLDAVELVGEQDIMGTPWAGSAWATSATAGTAWDGNFWRGVEWTGACWCGQSWTAETWEGKNWTGKNWTGKNWTSDVWAGKNWTGKNWTGKNWTGKNWTGDSWTGKNWTTPA